MKKALALMIVIGLVLSAIPAIAADKLLDVKITNAVEKVDKNGNPYMRLSFDEEKTLGATKYNESKTIMVFSDKLGLVKALDIKAGSNLKAVCSENEYKGRMGYVLVAFDPSMAKSVTPAVQVAPVIQAAPAATNTQAFSAPSSISVR